MPQYIYQCGTCPGHFEINHGMMEEETHCPQCESETFHRVPQMPFLKSSITPKGGKVRSETKSAIEANKAVLKDMKKNLANEWEPDK